MRFPSGSNAKDKTGAPGLVTNRLPVSDATDVPVTSDLTWGEAARTNSYNIYFGTDRDLVGSDSTAVLEYKGNQTALYFDPVAGGNLLYSTTYYWRVDTVNAIMVTKGQVWSFTTEDSPAAAPSQAADPDPANGAAGVAIDKILLWAGATGATSYDLYIGTSLSAVTNATASSISSSESFFFIVLPFAVIMAIR